MTNTYNFQHKHALLDTNIISALLRSDKKSKRYKPVFEFLQKNETFPYIIKDITDFEFVGYNANQNLYNKAQEWLNTFDGLTAYPDDFRTAKLLSAAYKCKNPNISPKQISFVDCLYAAQLVRVKSRAFIVTTDINDYPSFLFDMPHHISIETERGETSFVGFKTFNADKYQQLLKDFDKTK